MYGGRAIDNFDRRVLNTYMNEYMGDFIFDKFQPFHFYKNEKTNYFIPTLQTENEDVPKEMFLGKDSSIYFFSSQSVELKNIPKFC